MTACALDRNEIKRSTASEEQVFADLQIASSRPAHADKEFGTYYLPDFVHEKTTV